MIKRDGFEAAVMISMCKAAKMSNSAHVPEQAFARRFPGRGDKVRKALRDLIREGLVRKHPTRNEMTFELTKDGVAFCRELQEGAQAFAGYHPAFAGDGL